MPKTRKDLLYALADRIGGEHGQRIRAALKQPLFDNLTIFAQTYSAEQFAAELDRMERELRAALAKADGVGSIPGTWDHVN